MRPKNKWINTSEQAQSHLIEEITSPRNKLYGLPPHRISRETWFLLSGSSTWLSAGNWLLITQPGSSPSPATSLALPLREPQLNACSFPLTHPLTYLLRRATLEKQRFLNLSWRISPRVAQFCPQKGLRTSPLLHSLLPAAITRGHWPCVK